MSTFVTTFEQLIRAAYNTERVLGRRLMRSSGLAELEALKLTLEKAAGQHGLAHLLAVRAQARHTETLRLKAKAQTRIDLLALKQSKDAPPASAWIAFFDGSAHPNPGKIGLGGVILAADGQVAQEICQRAGHGNSSEAEYLALIAVLEAALVLPAPQLVVYGDSQVVINDVNQCTHPGAASLQHHRRRVIELLARLRTQMSSVELRWLPRHKNTLADRLSQQALTSWHVTDSADSAATLPLT